MAAVAVPAASPLDLAPLVDKGGPPRRPALLTPPLLSRAPPETLTVASPVSTVAAAVPFQSPVPKTTPAQMGDAIIPA